MRIRRGSISTQTALMLPVFVGAAALAVDLGYMWLMQAQARAAADSAVVAATSVFVLAQIDEDETVALARAEAAAGEHYVGNSLVDPANLNIEWATWDGSSLTVHNDFSIANAAVANIDQSSPSLFAKIFNVTDVSGASNSRGASVTGPAGSVECFLPIAMRMCLWPALNAADVTASPAPIYTTMGPNDNIGWAMPDLSGVPSPNTGSLQTQFRDFCSVEFGTDDTLDTGNGVNTPVVNTVADLINGTDSVVGAARREYWPNDTEYGVPDTPSERSNTPTPDAFGFSSSLAKNVSLITQASWGYVLGGPIPIINLGGTVGGDCSTSTGNFSGAGHAVEGFTYGWIYDARLGNASEKGFYIQLDFLGDYDFGTSVDPDALGNITGDGIPELLY